MSAAEIQRLAKFFGDYFAIFFRCLVSTARQVTHLPTYPPMTGTFPEKVDYKNKRKVDTKN